MTFKIEDTNVNSSVNEVYNDSTSINNSSLLTYPDTTTIVPNKRNYVIIFQTIDNSTSTFKFLLNVDTSKSQINDQLTIMMKISNPSGNSIKMILSTNFYLTYCGGNVANGIIETYIENFERLVFTFIFDGQKFVCTYDNC